MIYFNIPQARNQLLNKGFVYTLRMRHRQIGRTVALWYSSPLCFVLVQRETARVPEDLGSFVSHSGFSNIEEWLKAASMNARTLYLVAKI